MATGEHVSESAIPATHTDAFISELEMITQMHNPNEIVDTLLRIQQAYIVADPSNVDVVGCQLLNRLIHAYNKNEG